MAYVSQRLPFFLFPTELNSNHPLNSPTVGEKKNHLFFFSIKAEIKRVKREPAQVGIVAMRNLIM